MSSGLGDHLAKGLRTHVFYLQKALFYIVLMDDSLQEDNYSR